MKPNLHGADFIRIRETIKNFYKNQSKFSDYDFEGSAISFWLDTVAYGAHYHAAHSNLVFSETFLDTANERPSVVSRATELGYLSRSATASKARVNISFSVSGNPQEFILPKNTRFSAVVNGVSYAFTTIRDYIFENDGNGVFSKTIEIYQGKLTTYNHTFNFNDLSQRIIIPSKKADLRFLSVYVDAFPVPFADNIQLGNITPNTMVYFLKEAIDGFYEIYFGDGVVGRIPENGAVIELNYLITDGADANGARAFSQSSNIPNVGAISITLVEAANGGGEQESTESIKFLAPFYYQSQNRAVTEDDYKVLVLKNYSDIEDISVWGGEKNDPPFYGKVFMAVKPIQSVFLSNAIKQSIQRDVVSKFNILSIRPEIVDPDYIDVSVNTVIRYNARLYGATSSTSLENEIRESIENYFSDNLGKFGKQLYYSKLVSAIDSTSSLILNVVANLTLEKTKEIFTGISGTYKYTFNNAIHPGSVVSNDFEIGGLIWKIRDIPNPTVSGVHTTGRIAIYRTTDQGNIVFLNRNTGTVNYNTGEIEIKNIRIDSIVNDPSFKRLVIGVAPGALADVDNPQTAFTDYNVYTNERDQIIRLKSGAISITMIPDATV